jgi:hypothetical protein
VAGLLASCCRLALEQLVALDLGAARVTSAAAFAGLARLTALKVGRGWRLPLAWGLRGRRAAGGGAGVVMWRTCGAEAKGPVRVEWYAATRCHEPPRAAT